MKKLVSIAIILLLSACSQPMAKAENKGETVYNRNGARDNSFEAAEVEQPRSYLNVPQKRSLIQEDVKAKELDEIKEPVYKEPEPKYEEPKPVEKKKEPLKETKKELKEEFKQKPKEKLKEAEKEQDKEESKPSEEKKVKIVADDNKFIWPVQGKIISKFGSSAKADGINIAVNLDTPIKAAGSGTIIYAGDDLKSFGNLIIIQHKNKMLTSYGHMQSIIMKKDEFVKKGQVIGYVGESGNVAEPQLFFSIRENKKPIDPVNLLPKQQ